MRATADDLDRIVEFGRHFHAYSPWRGIEYDADATREFVARLIDGLGAVFITENGMVGGLLSPLFFNPSVLVGVEMFWWAPKDGRVLREEFEAWATEAGATAVQFSALADDNLERVDRIYGRAGFVRAETAYVKGLLNGGT